MLVDKATCAETAQSQWVGTCIAIVNKDMYSRFVRAHLGQSIHMHRMTARHRAGQICRSQTKVHKHVHNQAALNTRQKSWAQDSTCLCRVCTSCDLIVNLVGQQKLTTFRHTVWPYTQSNEDPFLVEDQSLFPDIAHESVTGISDGFFTSASSHGNKL